MQHAKRAVVASQVYSTAISSHPAHTLSTIAESTSASAFSWPGGSTKACSSVVMVTSVVVSVGTSRAMRQIGTVSCCRNVAVCDASVEARSRIQNSLPTMTTLSSSMAIPGNSPVPITCPTVPLTKKRVVSSMHADSSVKIK